MLCLSGFELYSRWVPLSFLRWSLLQKAKKLFKVSLLSLSKDSLVNLLGKTSRISASSFSSSSVICVKSFKHGQYFLPRKGYDSVSTSASFSFKQS